MTEILTFEQLPKAVTTLTKEVNELKQFLLKTHEQLTTDQAERLLNVQETADFLNLTVPTIYSKVSRGELPVMKRGKRLYFSDLELMQWLKDGKKKSNAELEAEAEAYLSNNKKGVRYGK